MKGFIEIQNGESEYPADKVLIATNIIQTVASRYNGKETIMRLQVDKMIVAIKTKESYEEIKRKIQKAQC